MVRKSERLSGSAKVGANHKRVASTTATPSAGAKRSKVKNATPTKSQYFHAGEDDEDTEDPLDLEAELSSGDGANSDFDDEEDVECSDPDADDDHDSESEPKSRKSSTPRKGPRSAAALKTRESQLSRPGLKTGLGPGTQVIIKKPKARPAGKTPYSDNTIHPNTLFFLKDLNVNNNREWLKMNDAEFRQAERDWHSYVEQLTVRLVEIDDTIPELPVKDVIFRVYRDVRFSADQTPYKPYFSAAWSRTGRKGPYAHYYIQISPNDETFIGGGLWHPEAVPTAAMRSSIDRHPERLTSVLMADDMRKSFLDGAPKNETKAVNAFVTGNAGNALKTKPKGYTADHMNIDLLRLRNYTIGRKLTDSAVLSTDGMNRVAELLACMKPFITYLNSVVMPDEEDSEDGDSGSPSSSGHEETDN